MNTPEEALALMIGISGIVIGNRELVAGHFVVR
jgi:hypothetical protein